LVPFPQFAKDDSREGDLDHHSMIFLDAFEKLFLLPNAGYRQLTSCYY